MLNYGTYLILFQEREGAFFLGVTGDKDIPDAVSGFGKHLGGVGFNAAMSHQSQHTPGHLLTHRQSFQVVYSN